MSVTDELRRLLDENRVEYREYSGVTNATMYQSTRFYVDNEEKHPYASIETVNEYDSVLLTLRCSPEQAIEATLGRGECRNLSKYYNEFVCSCCGWTYDFVTDPYSGPRYCPNCGRRIADGQPG